VEKVRKLYERASRPWNASAVKNQLDIKKVIFGITIFLFGTFTSYCGQPLIHGNDNALGVIVTVFSILAGFLVAIIAIIGDPLILSPGSWRIAEKYRQTAHNRLVRHKWLFLLYLMTLGFIFVTMLIPATLVNTVIWFERIYLFFASIAFILSLRLPGSLMKLQEERMDSIIESRRLRENIRPAKKNKN